MRVRVRAVRPGGDDAVERELVGAVRVQELAQPPRDLALAAPDPRLRGQRLEAAVGDAARALQLRDLLVVLDRAQLLDEAARRHELARALGERLPLRVRAATSASNCTRFGSRSAMSRISARFARTGSTPSTARADSM